VVCIVTVISLLLPSLAPDKPTGSSGGQTVYAGHIVTGGGWCACGCDNCVCDPGEVPIQCQRATPAPGKGGGKDTQDTSLFFLLGASLLLAIRFAWGRF